MFNCIRSGVVRSDHKWPLETRVEAHVNARWEHMRLEPSTCDRILKTGGKQGLIIKPVAHKWCRIEAFYRDGLWVGGQRSCAVFGDIKLF